MAVESASRTAAHLAGATHRLVNVWGLGEVDAQRKHGEAHGKRDTRVDHNHVIVEDPRMSRLGKPERGDHPMCPVCHSKVKSDRHFDKRVYDSQGRDLHSVEVFAEFVQADPRSLQMLERRFRKPDNSRKKPRLTRMDRKGRREYEAWWQQGG